MIQYREWARPKKQKDGWQVNANTPYKFEGFFLFGIIPLYVKRIGL